MIGDKVTDSQIPFIGDFKLLESKYHQLGDKKDEVIGQVNRWLEKNKYNKNMINYLLLTLRPYKYELLIFALFFVVPLVFLLCIKSKKLQILITFYCIWMMHRWEGFETVSFFYRPFMGSQYSMSIHHVDLLIPAVFFACLINKSLAGRIKAPTLGLFYLLSFLSPNFLLGLVRQMNFG